MRKHIFITGGASGIGKALAKRYLVDGANVSIFDRQDASAALAELKSVATSDQSINAFVIDVSDAQSVQLAFAQAAQMNPPNVVINCAGIAVAKAFSDTSADEFTRVININLIGSRNVAAAALPYLKKGGHLTFISSMAGLVACYGYAAYCASKHGVMGFAEVLRIELLEQGIKVSVVCPPEVDTPMVHQERIVRPKATETMKLLAGSLTLDDACQQIYAGIQAQKNLIIPGKKARFLWLMTKISPHIITQKVSDFMAART